MCGSSPTRRDRPAGRAWPGCGDTRTARRAARCRARRRARSRASRSRATVGIADAHLEHGELGLRLGPGRRRHPAEVVDAARERFD